MAPTSPSTESTKDEKPFLSDVNTLRARAREHIEEGAVTETYALDSKLVVKILNEALATEIVCVLRYKRHYFMAKGIVAGSVAEEFLEHASEEQEHADRIAERIVQLGGEPNFSPEGLASRSHSEYVEGETLVDMIKENLVAERVGAARAQVVVDLFAGEDE
jgi:bacterioferritin